MQRGRIFACAFRHHRQVFDPLGNLALQNTPAFLIFDLLSWLLPSYQFNSLNNLLRQVLIDAVDFEALTASCCPAKLLVCATNVQVPTGAGRAPGRTPVRPASVSERCCVFRGAHGAHIPEFASVPNATSEGLPFPALCHHVHGTGTPNGDGAQQEMVHEREDHSPCPRPLGGSHARAGRAGDKLRRTGVLVRYGPDRAGGTTPRQPEWRIGDTAQLCIRR
jgi:hypothetical protein